MFPVEVSDAEPATHVDQFQGEPAVLRQPLGQVENPAGVLHDGVLRQDSGTQVHLDAHHTDRWMAERPRAECGHVEQHGLVDAELPRFTAHG